MGVLARYRLVLGLYTKTFRREFSEEMSHVFEQRFLERGALGGAAALGFVVGS